MNYFYSKKIEAAHLNKHILYKNSGLFNNFAKVLNDHVCFITWYMSFVYVFLASTELDHFGDEVSTFRKNGKKECNISKLY